MNHPTAEDFKVVYLTGAPATGKSTVAHLLAKMVSPVALFEYGKELTTMLRARHDDLNQESLRTLSSLIASPDDIAKLDSVLLDFVARKRESAHVVIDSHAVTKERYGYSCTPFSLKTLGQLHPTMIVVLYASPEVIVERIARDPGGRSMVTQWEADFHTQLQATVAISYSVSCAAPAFFFDVARGSETVAKDIAARIG